MGLGAIRDAEVFGELLLHHRTRATSVWAVTSCDLYVLHKSDFDRVLRDHPAFTEGVRSETAHRSGDTGG